jgi:hypothetical protein
MGVLAFYPWLTLKARARLGDWSLVPWFREEPDPQHWDAEAQQLIDRVLRPFHAGPEAKVDTATIAIKDGTVIGNDLADADLEELLNLSELVTFAGLAERRFFAQDGYVNTGSFRLIIQKWQDLGRGVTIRSRRRDGFGTNYIPSQWHKESPSPEVTLNERLQPNQPLIDALVAFRAQPEWSRYSLAIPLFNRANTDGADMSQEMEGVLISSALERLLDSSAKESDLAQKFVRLMTRHKHIPRSEWTRVREGDFKKSETLGDVWIRDFWRIRGMVAHGHRAEDRTAVWTLPEHLLLAAFAFPLLVKLDLMDLGHYELSSLDEVRLDAFEGLLNTSLFEKSAEGKWPWNRAMQAAWFKPTGLKLTNVDKRTPDA